MLYCLVGQGVHFFKDVIQVGPIRPMEGVTGLLCIGACTPPRVPHVPFCVPSYRGDLSSSGGNAVMEYFKACFPTVRCACGVYDRWGWVSSSSASNPKMENSSRLWYYDVGI